MSSGRVYSGVIFANPPAAAPAAPSSAAPVPTSVADINVGINRAEFDALFADGASKDRRPVTVVEEINRDFRTDPVDAVRKNAGYHIDDATLSHLTPEVQNIAAAREQQARVADLLWSNDDFEFFKLVQGFTGDRTLVDREMGTGAGVPLLQPRPLTDIATRPLNTTRPLETDRPAFFLPAGKTPEDITSAQERNRVLGNVDRLMEQPQVSGEMQMSSVLWGAINEALVQLYLMNRRKYGGKVREHFYRDRTVKVLFAKLVAKIIILNKMPTDGQFHQIPITPMRNVELKNWLGDLDNSARWDPHVRYFISGTDDDVDRTKGAKRMKFLDTYNPDSWKLNDD